ncbi:MAG: hypothetical protein IPH95_16405 [Candidatus Promineofilum sp.]|nr:hypothetical protein [Promineifilum sp.]
MFLVADHGVDPVGPAQGADDAADDALLIDLGHALGGLVTRQVAADNVLGRLAHQPLVLADPQVEVGGGHVGELAAQPLRRDGIDQRPVDVVIPRGDGIGVADVALALRAQVVVVGGDVFAQAGIFGRVAQVQIGVGP